MTKDSQITAEERQITAEESLISGEVEQSSVTTQMNYTENSQNSKASSPIFDFLSTPQGTEIAQQLINTVQGLKQQGSKAEIAMVKFEKIITCILVIAVITAVTALTYFSKFTPSIGVLFGSLVGYIYGKRS